MSKTILIVDDAKNLRLMVAGYLEQEGFRTITAANGREALQIIESEEPDLIILDLMMPQMGGYDFLREYAPHHSTPIIVLTARLEEKDKVKGLELGADDYVTKPFSMRELTARVRAVLRRLEKAQASSSVLQVGGLSLDRKSRLVWREGCRVDLTPSEFTLLETLMAAPGKVFSRLDLLERLQGGAYQGYERTIDVHIRNLRSKIEPEPHKPRYIETVYGAGYRFRADM
ncbi:MAG: response regulator transcription factor [Chloroflexi bacterium]|nr:response regulator transcription factor [Chloroflexota bacterium]